jgi:virulence factor Mce-like protein
VTARLRLLVGALAVVLGATVLPACGLLPGGEGSYTLHAYFPRAVSVFPSSDVRVLGLPAGSVSAVEVEGDQVRIDLKIKDSIDVPADVRAQIVPQSLIGERYIQLSPVFEKGMERAKDGMTIDRDHTIIPVEPDEALAAVKKFLDSLDPKGIGRLVTNLEEDLRGNGSTLNSALGSLSDLVTTFAEKDDALVRIVDSFDKLTATLSSREQQLGEVLDAFATASQVLADERGSIEGLVRGLADLSQSGLRLVGEHAGPLRSDVQTLADTAAVIDANLSAVEDLLEAGGNLAAGVYGAYNPELRALNLRNNFGPLVPEVIDALLGQLGVPALCLPVTATCGVAGRSEGSATPARITTGTTPVGALLELLGRPTTSPGSDS